MRRVVEFTGAGLACLQVTCATVPNALQGAGCRRRPPSALSCSSDQRADAPLKGWVVCKVFGKVWSKRGSQKLIRDGVYYAIQDWARGNCIFGKKGDKDAFVENANAALHPKSHGQSKRAAIKFCLARFKSNKRGYFPSVPLLSLIEHFERVCLANFTLPNFLRFSGTLIHSVRSILQEDEAFRSLFRQTLPKDTTEEVMTGRAALRPHAASALNLSQSKQHHMHHI